ncbi:MAG: tyrosine--tRNA ligase [Anaerolineae bacterium]|nr:tyrosine--tRNA ligase [Anaerolineae bacterium]
MTTVSAKPTIDEQVEILMSGADYGDPQIKETMTRELRERLIEAERAGRPLRIYCGYDPRTTDLHLGHTITMRKLRQFQELGHDVTFLIGSFTSLIGDPSDVDKARAQLTPEQVEINAQTYAEQAFKILDRARTRVRYNAEWLAPLTFKDLIEFASHFTVQQFLQRDNFKKRLEAGEPIWLHETFYSLMQAYDAVAQETDVQVGGQDQLFNIVVAGRQLMERLGMKPQVAIIMGELLPGTDGEIKMSKSLGNHIPIMSTPEDMFGKIMSLPDKAMPIYHKLLLGYSPPQLAAFNAALADGSLHPRDAKMNLARQIVTIFHGPEGAARGEEHFRTVFQRGELPDMPDHPVNGEQRVVDLMADLNMVRSKGEARRLIDQGGVRLNGAKVGDAEATVRLAPGADAVLQVGKRKFVRLVGGK